MQKEVLMNEIDKENLRFLLTADKKELEEWWDNVSEYEHKYALSLLKCFSLTLTDQAQSITGDLSLAKQVIDKVKAKR